MKNIYKSIFGFAALAVLASACDTSNVSKIYEPADSGVSFARSVETATNLSPSLTSYTISVVRSDASAAETVSIASTMDEAFNVPSSVSFAAGEYSTGLAINLEGLPIGQVFSGTISFADETQYNANVAISSVEVRVSLSYTWESLGNGQFIDAFLYDSGYVGTPEVRQAAENPNLYRFYSPWPSGSITGLELDSALSYLEIEIGEDGSVAYGDYVATGWVYPGYGEIYYMEPGYFGEAGAEYNCVVDDNLIQFYWYPYIPDAGIWWGQAFPAYLALPAFSGDLAETIGW